LDSYNYMTYGAQEIEYYLGLLFSRYHILDLQNERVIRGVLHPRFAGMRNKVEQYLRPFPGRYSFEQVGEDIYLTISASIGPQPRQNWKLHAGLFLATVFTTLLAGSLWETGNIPSDPAGFLLGLPFSGAIMLILLIHEFGHYFAARHHGMDVTLPFFIPMPSFFGTAGALIKMRSPMFSRRMLLDVGAAGPIAGFLVSVPVFIYGLMSSHWMPVSEHLATGNSLLISWLSRAFLGAPPPGFHLDMSSVAFAGWIGFFVTALNLMPIGQLDGGHISYALFGRRHTRLAYAFFILLLALGYLWPGWIFWALLVLVVIRIKHPPIIDEEIPLDPKRRVVGIATLCILILTFMPMPLPA